MFTFLSGAFSVDFIYYTNILKTIYDWLKYKERIFPVQLHRIYLNDLLETLYMQIVLIKV